MTQLVERGEERRVNKRGNRVLSSVSYRSGGGTVEEGAAGQGGEGFVEFALFRLCA